MGGWVVGGWVVGWSNVILDPTLALIRAQLGFRIQVGAKCGYIYIKLMSTFKHGKTFLNPIAQEPFIPCVLRVKAESAPHLKSHFLDFTHIKIYVYLAKIMKNIKNNLENRREMKFLEKFSEI